MKKLLRGLKRHFGITARHVAVRSDLPWYWKSLLWLLFAVTGYGIGYWQFSSADARSLAASISRLELENQALQARLVHAERQSQVDRAAQSNLAREMTALQDDDMQLKEEIAFYKSILAESATSGVAKLHSVKLSKGSRSGEYQYRILLVQSGRHDKNVQGSLRFSINGKPLLETVGGGNGIKINFKYYQRVEGSFTLADFNPGKSLQVEFFETGNRQPKLTQNVSLPI
jgi:hypothetical protein